jgi:hypothetical protein
LGVLAIEATEIDNCTVLSTPDLYTLKTSISNSDVSYCINITSANVTLDYQGNTIDDDAMEFEIVYETPRPTAVETETPRGKEILISSELHYDNILADAYLTEEAREHTIRLFHLVDDTRILHEFTAHDTNGNGLVDYITWIVPHLSEQVFIIEITKAEHLDRDRQFISDIYDDVATLDGFWSETINEDEYVRVVFERELTSVNDITIYPRIVNGTPIIIVYEAEETEEIARFSSINQHEYNKVLLTDLVGGQDTAYCLSRRRPRTVRYKRKRTPR